MDNKPSASEIEQLSDVEVGEILRRTRVHYGQSLKDVEQILRIRQSQIDAIEKGEIHKLPGRVYAIGFVRSYAEYLGLDGAKVVQLFKAQYIDRQPREVLSFPVPASETRTPPIWLVWTSLAMLVVFVGIWSYWLSSSTDVSKVDVKAIEPMPGEIQERIAEKVAPSAEFQGEISGPMPENMGVKGQKTGIILKLLSNSWVEIKDADGTMIVSNVLNKGDQYFVPDSPGLSMSLGNAGGVEIVLEGRALMPLGKEGDVLRDIPLDINHLKTLEFKPEVAPAVEEEEPKKAETPQN